MNLEFKLILLTGLDTNYDINVISFLTILFYYNAFSSIGGILGSDLSGPLLSVDIFYFNFYGVPIGELLELSLFGNVGCDSDWYSGDNSARNGNYGGDLIDTFDSDDSDSSFYEVLDSLFFCEICDESRSVFDSPFYFNFILF